MVVGSIAYVMTARKGGEATQTPQDVKSLSSQTPALVATGNPNAAINSIIDSASQENTAASQDSELNSITSSDTTVSTFDGVYNENEF